MLLCFLLGHGVVFQLILFEEAVGVFLVLSLSVPVVKCISIASWASVLKA